MADDGATDVMTTPEQVLAAGGVSKRRRGASSSKRRSPSGRRAPTPEPPKELLLDLEKADEAQADDSPSATEVMVVTKRRSTKEKTLVTKRSLSSPGEGRQPLIEASDLKTQSPTINIETTVIRRRSSSSNAARNEETPVVSTITTSAFLEKVPVPSPVTKPIPIRSIRPTEFTTEEIFLPAVQSQEPEAPTLKEVVVKAKEVPVVEKEEVMVIKKEIVPMVRKEEIVVKTEVLREKKEEEKDQEAVVKPEVIVKKVIPEGTAKEKKTEGASEVKKIKEPDVGEKLEVKAVEKKREEKEKPIKKEEKEKPRKVEETEKPEVIDSKSSVEKTPEVKEAIWGPFFREVREEWGKFVVQHSDQWQKIVSQRNRCIGAFLLMFIYCGLGGLIFRFTEGAFEAFYKCGVKRVKRDFIDSLWLGSHNLKEDDWKSQARKKLMELENQLHAAHEAGVTTYSGQRAWSFLNAIVYCLTVVTTIGYGHISPSTTTGRAITIVYAIFGIPLFLILLADFGKLFTRGIKFVWAFVRRVYYTGSCKKVRRTVPVQEVMKGVQLVYDFATFRRPSQIVEGTEIRTAPIAKPEDVELQVPLNQNQAVQQLQPQEQQNQQPTILPLDGHEVPGTPALSTFEVDDEFNLPISVAIIILLIYIFVGATIYWTWEEWGFFESFYFVFISMSTIGFGDFVPQHPMYMMASIVYLVFGLALTSMCINVVQEKLSDSFRQASAKLGATIGLRVNEEDGSITPVATAPLETNEVQNALPKSHST